MIELLLVADRLLATGDLERAERIYGQIAEADPRNAIAVVGLARVADARGERDAARDLAERALAIDPDDEAARRLAGEWAEPHRPPLASDQRPPARPSILARIRAFLGLAR